jgi:hypothetical protein
MDDAGQAHARLLGMLICQAAPIGAYIILLLTIRTVRKMGNSGLWAGRFHEASNGRPSIITELSVIRIPPMIHFAQKWKG